MFHQTIFTQNPKYDHLLAAIDIVYCTTVNNPPKLAFFIL